MSKKIQYNKPVSVLKLGRGQSRKKLGLYFHIPFCLKKCSYCDFYSVSMNRAKMKEYISAMIQQMTYYRAAASTYQVDTLYLGGGTPSLLQIPELKRLMDGVRANFNLSEKAEITMEVNPATGGKSYFKKAAKLGVNRFSIGLQSAVDSELKAIGRVHSLADFEETMDQIACSKVENIGVDLMYGLPGQTLESFRKSLDYVTALPVTHLSVYGLTLEEGTPLYQVRETLPLPDEETERSMYFDAIEKLGAAGFSQDEISNFSKPGYYSRHNFKYWNCDEYLGIGAAASSFFGGRRFTFSRSIGRYISAMGGGSVEGLLSENIEFPFGECLGDYVMLRLRLREGVVFSEFKKRYRKDFCEMFAEKIAKYTGTEFLEFDDRHVALTPEGMYVSNYIISDFLEF